MRTPQKNPHSKQEVTFEGACALVETALQGTVRQEIVAAGSRSENLGKALLRLRESMRINVWKAGAHHISLDSIITQYDSRTRRDGFHVLHDWDGKADRVNDDTIPVDVLNYLIDKRGAEPFDRTALAILVDYYFLHVLSLLSLRVWDEGQPDRNLDRLNQLLGSLQGRNGSGQPFVDNAETLILIATSHFELDERGFGKLLEKVRTFNRPHRTNIALGHAASMGCHLRFGFEATCGRDTVALRDDNAADYPWLCFALATLMSEYARTCETGERGAPPSLKLGRTAEALAEAGEPGVEARLKGSPSNNAGTQGVEREAIVEGMLNGLTPDARAFVGDHPPASLSACEVERSGFATLFHQHRPALLEDFERHRPSDQMYSPISFSFNFSHNILKGTIVDALMWGEAWDLTFNDLLRGSPAGDAKSQLKATLANTLMGYARTSPDRIRGRLMPVITYDPLAGRQAFGLAMRKIRE
jgi:hypothetical protein